MFLSLKNACEEQFYLEDYALPQRIHCEKCGRVLYESFELKSPFEIIELYEGKCPRCDRKLSPVPIRVEITRIK